MDANDSLVGLALGRLALLNTVGILPVIYILTHRSEPASKPGNRHDDAPGPAPEN